MNTHTIETITRFVPIDDLLATAGQPTEEQLSLVAASGFQVVINLALHDDPRYSLKDEAAVVTSLGMEYIHIPIEFTAPTAGGLFAFFRAMDSSFGRKVLVHCAHNKRVPVFLALYRIGRLGWEPRTALDAMRKVWEPDETWSNFAARLLCATRI